MRIDLACLLAIAPLGLVGCMSSQNVATLQANGAYAVAAGDTVVMPNTYMTLDPQCRPLKLPTATVVRGPQQGKLKIVQIKSAAQYGKGPMRHCHGVQEKSLAIQYSAARNARGQDAFTVRIRCDDGETKVVSYKINVR